MPMYHAHASIVYIQSGDIVSISSVQIVYTGRKRTICCSRLSGFSVTVLFPFRACHACLARPPLGPDLSGYSQNTLSLSCPWKFDGKWPSMSSCLCACAWMCLLCGWVGACVRLGGRFGTSLRLNKSAGVNLAASRWRTTFSRPRVIFSRLNLWLVLSFSRVSRSCSLVAFVVLVSVAFSLLMSRVLSCTLSSVDGRRPGRSCVALASQMMQAWSPPLAHYRLGGTSKAARRDSGAACVIQQPRHRPLPASSTKRTKPKHSGLLNWCVATQVDELTRLSMAISYFHVLASEIAHRWVCGVLVVRMRDES